MKKFWKFGCLVLLGGFFFGVWACVDSAKSDLEEAYFLLDQGKFSEAADKARSVWTADSTNLEAQYVLAVALLSDGALGERSSCPGDTGIFGLVACLQDDPGSTDSPFSTFSRIAPEADKITKIEEARDLLIALAPQITEETQKSTVYLQLFFSRLFEIAGALTRIGATNDNEVCNALPLDETKIDTIPDGFDANALTLDQETRFEDNLAKADEDAQKAGLGDLGLSDRVQEIKTSLDAIGAVEDFFTSEFASDLTCTDK